MYLFVFVSPMGFVKGKLSHELKYVCALDYVFVDLDLRDIPLPVGYQGKGYTFDQILGILEADYFRKVIPEPNIIIKSSDTGMWLLYRVNESTRAFMRWNRLEHLLIEALKDLGADSKACDACRVARVDGSINSKDGSVVRYTDYSDEKYTIYSIMSEYFPKEACEEILDETNSKYSNMHNYDTKEMLMRRICDIKNLLFLRNKSAHWEGSRELCLFLIRNFMLQQGISDAEATDEIERLNNSLIHPIPENVAKVTKSAFKCYLKECGGYKYTTEKLIELLQIQEEEFQHLTVLVPTKMRKAGKKSRKAINRQNYERRCAKNGTGVYKDKKAEKLEQIKKYLEEGKKQAEICELMGISRRTFYNYKKEIACNSNDVIPVEENNIVTIQSDDATCVAEEGKNICSENGANSSDTYIRVRSTTTEMGGTEFVQDEDITPSSGKTEEFGETILGNMGIDAVEEVTNGERTTFSVLLTGQKPFLREYQGNLLMYRSKLPSGFVNHRIIRLPVGEITNFTNFRT